MAIAKPTEETFFMDHPGNPSTAANHDVPLPESVSKPSQGYGKEAHCSIEEWSLILKLMWTGRALRKVGSCAFAHFFEQLVATPYSAEQGCK